MVQNRSDSAATEAAVTENGGTAESPKPLRLRLPELLNGPFNVRSLALTGLFVLALFYTLYFTRAVLLPLVLASLLSYLLSPLVRALKRAYIPPPIGAAFILLSLLGLFGYGLAALSTPAAGWLEKAPYSIERLRGKLLPLKKPIEKVAQASNQIADITSPTPKTPQKETVEIKQSPINDLLFVQTPEFLVSAALLIILLYFLLASDGVFLTKLIKLMPTLSDKKRAVTIAHEIERHISRYLLTITAINICLGMAVGTAVYFLGLPNPILWGSLVAVLNFIPYLGALTGIVCMTLAAILSFNSLGYALVFPATYLAIATLEGQLITPMVLGRSLTLNPVIVLLSLTFWGWMWGIAGVILAVPLLAAFKIVCTHIEQTEPIAEFLS
jgi:predicted PurR-regulated permease PerM